MPSLKVFGALWLMLAIYGLAVTGYESLTEYQRAAQSMERDPVTGAVFYGPWWWFVLTALPTLYVAVLLMGAGLILQKRWAIWMLRVLAPLALIGAFIYNLLLLMFGASALSWLIGVVALALAASSTSFAYAAHKPAA